MLLTQPLRQIPGDFDRRWMSDDFFDLIVWYEPSGNVHGFQLCYGKKSSECALTWTRSHGFSHTAVDAGEQSPNANNAPVLTQVGARDFPLDLVVMEFTKRTSELDSSIRELVLEQLGEYARRLNSHKAA